jgi:hypothetical protein
MKCFHEIQTDIAQQCSATGNTATGIGSTQTTTAAAAAAAQYARDFIEPLVEQTRQVVVAQCTISPLYEQYFTSVATPSEWRRTTATTTLTAAAATIVAFLVARWRPTLFGVR